MVAGRTIIASGRINSVMLQNSQRSSKKAFDPYTPYRFQSYGFHVTTAARALKGGELGDDRWFRSFDIPREPSPLYTMRCVRVGLLSALSWCVVYCCAAQSPVPGVQSASQSSTPVAVHTNSSTRVLSSPLAEMLPRSDFKPIDQDHPEVSAGKKWRIGGPLISIFKGGTVRRAPGRFFQWINPFRRSTEEESATTSGMEFERYQNLSTRPWNGIVGWHPTHSTLPDAVTHEGGIQLISISPNR